MKTATDFRIEYAYFSWDYDFPPEIEKALEDDYVINHRVYDTAALKRVATLLLIDPDAPPSSALAAAQPI